MEVKWRSLSSNKTHHLNPVMWESVNITWDDWRRSSFPLWVTFHQACYLSACSLVGIRLLSPSTVDITIYRMVWKVIFWPFLEWESSSNTCHQDQFLWLCVQLQPCPELDVDEKLNQILILGAGMAALAPVFLKFSCNVIEALFFNWDQIHLSECTLIDVTWMHQLTWC